MTRRSIHNTTFRIRARLLRRMGLTLQASMNLATSEIPGPNGEQQALFLMLV